MPRLARFWARHPAVEIAPRPSGALADLARGEADLAIRYGDGDWPGLTVEPFLPADFVVVASPALAATAPEFRRTPWAFEPYSDELRGWEIGHDLMDDATRIDLNPSNALTLAAVRAGLGLSAQTRVNVARDLAARTMVALHAVPDASRACFLVAPSGSVPAARRIFADWLR